VLYCYYNWARHNKHFKVIGNETYNYRNIQKDSMRCYLLYIPLSIKRYLIHVCDLPKEEFNAE
jgi:hypothetical protein